MSHKVGATKVGRWNWLWLAVIAAWAGASAPLARAQFGVAITPAAALNTNAGSDSGKDHDPQLTTDGSGNWVAVWRSNENLGGTIGTDNDILTARSTDNGASWTAPAVLNTNATVDSGIDFIPQLTTDGSGNWVAVWERENVGGTVGADNDILTARSTDNGANWTAPAVLYANAASDSGNDSRPQLTTDGSGNWVAVWYSNEGLGGTIGVDTDILTARSTDNGASWTAPAPLNSNAGVDSGQDFNPQVATDGSGNWVAVWYPFDDLGGTIGADTDILTARFALPDCNLNGVGDGQDLTDGVSSDCNANGIPDSCETDSDADGVIDPCDNCPAVANDQSDGDGDGVGDACDGCPSDGGKTAPGACGCGVPDTDTDGDGTPDCFDACPTDPAKTAPGLCGCGAPDTDSDGDGTPDCADGCPNDPAKITAGVCGCGVLDTDSDGDGVPDCIDNCPNDPNPDQADADTNGVGDACVEAPAGGCAPLCGLGGFGMMPLMFAGVALMRRRRHRA